jgi:GTP cyclohydrolase IA
MGAPDRRAAAVAIDAFLRALGRDPASEPELVGTGERVAAAYLDELCDGYGVDAGALLRGEAIRGTTEVVAVHDIPVSTVCPHHLLPARGVASIAFGPREWLVGLGTLVRVLDAFAHRLALQEEIGERVAEALFVHLSPRWVSCRIVLEHACLSSRGARREGVRAETMAFVGDTSFRPAALGILDGSSAGATK